MTILTAITKYTIQDIKTFVLSLNKTTYTGRKVALIYDITDETKQFLKLNGWELYQGELSEHIILQRFKDSYYLLNSVLNLPSGEVILWVDIKDIVFQNNPEHWIQKNMKLPIMAFSECIKLKDDPWAVVNSGTSFPMEWEWMNDKTSYCAGTIAGTVEYTKDLFLNIYRWSKTTSNPQQLSDQAAFNVLINLSNYKNIVQFVNQEQGFITQLGTVYIKKNEFGSKLLEPTPILKNEKFYTNNNIEFCLVHQYDRDNKLKELIVNAYSN